MRILSFHGRDHRGEGADPIPPGQRYYATPFAPASTPDDYISDGLYNSTFENGAVNAPLPDGSYSPLCWYFTPGGKKRLEGAVAAAVGDVIVTLPEAFWPETDYVGSILSVDGSLAMGVAISASTGEVTCTAPSAPSTTGGASGVAAGTYGDAADVPQVTVGADGRIVSALNVAIQIAESAVTGLVSDLAAKLGLSVFTTKGDLVVASGSAAVSRLAVGSNGQGLVADSTQTLGVKWGTVSGDKLGLTPTAVKTSAYNAAVGDLVPCDTNTTGAFTVTLPTAPTDGSVVGVKHVIQGSTHAVTIAAGGSDVFDKASGLTSITLAYVNQGVILQYKASGAIWYVIGEEPTTGVSAGTYGDSGDVPQITVDAKGRVTAVANVSIGGGTIVGADGWVPSSDTWVYASGSGGGTATFTIAGVDRTLQLSPGTRIKLTQSGVAYFVVAAVAFSTNTTVTVTGGSDYTLANATITSPNYSYVANPQGYPSWFNFATAAAGFSAITTNVGRFAVVGRQCQIAVTITGTSNATTFNLTAPIPNNAANTAPFEIPVINTIGGNTQLGRIAFTTSTNVRVDAVPTASNGWTASGSKQTLFNVTYEI